MGTTYAHRPAEQVTWRELFTTPASVAANGGTLVGAPVPNRGLPLNGTTQYATFALEAGDMGGPYVSIVCEFTPDFTPEEDAYRVLFSATAGGDYSVFRRDGDGKIGLTLGDKGIATVNLEDYAEYWRTGQKNIIVVSGRLAHIDMWLNGHLIIDDDGESWAFKNPATLYVGCDNTGASFFRGTIHSLDFRNGLLKQDDATFLERRGIGGPWRYRTDAMVWLDTVYHFTDRNGLLSTRDKSVRERNFLVLEGVAAINAPVFHAPGYYCNPAKGAGYLHRVEPLNLPIRNEVTFVMAMMGDFKANGSDARTFWNTAGPCAHYAARLSALASCELQIDLGGTTIDSLTLAEYEFAWKPYGLNVLVVAGRSEDTCAWLNGIQIMAHNTTAFEARDVPSCYVGATAAGADGFRGMIWHFSIWPYKALPMQVQDVTALMRSLYSWD